MEGFTKREINILKITFVSVASVLAVLYVVITWRLLLFLVPLFAKIWIVGKVILLVCMFAIPILGMTVIKGKIIRTADRVAVSVLLAMTSMDDYERVKRAIEVALANDKKTLDDKKHGDNGEKK